jgi:cellulose biosynthesis protein BcsQ
MAEYACDCKNLTNLFRKHTRCEVRTLLNLGYDGEKNVFNLKKEFTVTGLDLSPAMLDNARVLNPESRFIEADMRNFFLLEKYDAVLVDDGIAYMATEIDLLAVFKYAYAHLHPGGVMFVGPDYTTETIIQNKSSVTLANPDAKPANIDVVFVENNYDPDPDDIVFDALMLITRLSFQGSSTLTGRDWFIIAWMAVANTALAFTLWNRTLQVLTAVE